MKVTIFNSDNKEANDYNCGVGVGWGWGSHLLFDYRILNINSQKKLLQKFQNNEYFVNMKEKLYIETKADKDALCSLCKTNKNVYSQPNLKMNLVSESIAGYNSRTQLSIKYKKKLSIFRINIIVFIESCSRQNVL